MDIHISVRNLVEFILRSGDIDNRKAVAPENAMQEGSRYSPHDPAENGVRLSCGGFFAVSL